MDKKISKNILLTIMGVLVLIELVLGIITISENVFVSIFKLIPLVFVALYGFWLYKKPHDNMLKYTMLILAVGQIIYAIAGWNNFYNQTVRILAMAIIIYVAGRLDRIEQNKYLLLISLIVQLMRCIIVATIAHAQFTPLYVFTWFSGVFATITLMIAYFVRYKEHKEAGLTDSPKE